MTRTLREAKGKLVHVWPFVLMCVYFYKTINIFINRDTLSAR